MEESIRKLKEYMDAGRYTVAITGAGISLAAGGVTFEGMFSHGHRPGWVSSDPAVEKAWNWKREADPVFGRLMTMEI